MNLYVNCIITSYNVIQYYDNYEIENNIIIAIYSIGY